MMSTTHDHSCHGISVEECHLNRRGGKKLHCISQGCTEKFHHENDLKTQNKKVYTLTYQYSRKPGSNLSQHLNGGLINSQPLSGRAQLDDLDHLLLAVWKCPDDQQPEIEIVGIIRMFLCWHQYLSSRSRGTPWAE